MEMSTAPSDANVVSGKKLGSLREGKKAVSLTLMVHIHLLIVPVSGSGVRRQHQEKKSTQPDKNHPGQDLANADFRAGSHTHL